MTILSIAAIEPTPENEINEVRNMNATELLQRLPTKAELRQRLAENQRERAALKKLLKLDLPEEKSISQRDGEPLGITLR